MTDGDGAEPDALEARKPRTDWLLRRWRVVIVALVLIPLIARVVADATRRRGGRDDEPLGPMTYLGVLAIVAVLVWQSFAFGRFSRKSRARRAAAAAEPWRRHGYWSESGEKRFVAFAPSRTTAALRRLLERTAFLALASAFVLGGLGLSQAALATCVAGLASLAVVFVTGIRGYANTGVEWREQPARTGAAAHYVLRIAPWPRGRLDRVEVTLRCVVETSRRRGLQRPEVACPFSTTRLFADELPDFAAVALHARFDVPAGLPAADPDGEPAVFWELVVAAERRGSRFDETFLVPVGPALS